MSSKQVRICWRCRKWGKGDSHSNGAGTADPCTFALFIHGGKNNSITNNLFVIPYLGSFTDFSAFQIPVCGWVGIRPPGAFLIPA